MKLNLMEDESTCSDGFDHAVLLCISGSGTMTAETGETLAFQKGQCVFLPVDTTVKELSGTVDLLWITA